MILSTKGIVLRSIKYGETSLVSSIYTQSHGLQTYMINGVRTYTKKGPGKASLFQPAAILDLVIYHNDLKNLQRLKDYKWGHLYRNIFSDVIKNTVALFMVEMLQKTIRQPEPNEDLYDFIEDALIHLDEAGDAVTGNFPLFFALHLASFFGFRISDNYSSSRHVLDLVNGTFVEAAPDHPHFIDGEMAGILSQLLKTFQPHDLESLEIKKKLKSGLLEAVLTFYTMQIPEFGAMRTLPVLREILR